jgi:hypothetical protein
VPAEYIKFWLSLILARTSHSKFSRLFSWPLLPFPHPRRSPLKLSCLPMRALQIASAPSLLSRLRFGTRISSARLVLTTAKTTSPQRYPYTTFNSSAHLHITQASPLRPLHNIMSDDKGRKQATLGYVPDSQLTIGCVNGIAFVHQDGS